MPNSWTSLLFDLLRFVMKHKGKTFGHVDGLCSKDNVSKRLPSKVKNTSAFEYIIPTPMIDFDL